MQSERIILSAILSDRQAFNKLTTYGAKDDLTDKSKLIWDEVQSYYDLDQECANVDKTIIKQRLARKFPKHKDLFSSVIDSLEPVSIPNIMEEAIKLKEENVRDRLSAAFASGTAEQIEQLLEEYRAITKAGAEAQHRVEVMNNISIRSIVEESSSANRIKLIPDIINKQLNGGVLRKHHIVIFAPTDMGKTLFLLNLVYGFLKQDLRVLYVGNEDPANDIIRRMSSRLSGININHLEKYIDKVESILAHRNWKNFFLAEVVAGNSQEIEACVEEYKPDILIVDQIRNLDMGEKNFVRTLESAAQMMRRLGKKYNLVPISVTQAADSATGKNFLARGDIDNSNVGIPGTADLMIGIGADQNTEAEGYRWLSFVKNKVGGIKEPIKVKFDPLKTKVE